MRGRVAIMAWVSVEIREQLRAIASDNDETVSEVLTRLVEDEFFRAEGDMDDE